MRHALIWLSLVAATAFSGSAWAYAFRLPPEVLFHAGSRTPLSQDVQAHEISQSVWDQFIMGNQTTWKLPSHRRGLYGGADLAVVARFATGGFGLGKRNWAIAVRLRETCRQDARVDSGVYNLDDHSRFAQWFERTGLKGSPLADHCTGKRTGEAHFSWHPGTDYSLDSSSRQRQYSELCSPVIERYMNEMNIGVVQDQEWEESWYVRDRSCIERIEGTPDDLFRIIFEGQINIFGHQYDSEDLRPEANLSLLIQALACARSHRVPLFQKRLAHLAERLFRSEGDLRNNQASVDFIKTMARTCAWKLP
jgi:hypothetical protein